MKRICIQCKIEKPIKDFHRKSNHGSGIVCSKQCKTCRYLVIHNWKIKNYWRVKEYNRTCGTKLRKQVLAHYGGHCVCCKESTYEFLAIDHTNNDGNIHRKKIGRSSGANIARWLRDNNFPEGFQILCHNCNMAKRLGKCPHKNR